jgi:autotransporter-associated beta strand protein
MKTQLHLFAGRSFALILFALIMMVAPQAYAATKTWSGAVDSNFNVAGNWSPAGVPSNGDDLVFDSDTATSLTPANDLTGASFLSLTFQGNDPLGFDLSGNSFTLTGGITNNSNGPAYILTPLVISGNQSITATNHIISLDGAISGAGNLTKSGGQSLFITANNSTYSGNITISGGVLWVDNVNGLGNTSGITTVIDGAYLQFDLSTMGANPTIAEPLTLAGDGDGTQYTNYALGVYDTGVSNLTLSGNIILAADTKVGPWKQLTLTGALSGTTYNLAVAQGQYGKLIVQASSNTSSTPNGTYEAPKVTTTLSDNQSGIPVSIGYNETVVITGTRQSINVGEGGVLKGTGTVGFVDINTGAFIAPGLSPGCLNTGDLTLSGTFLVEIGGTVVCTGYDQLRVTGTVDVTAGTLTPSLFGGFTPAVGQSYTIIDNDGADAITGTFAGIAEGGTITVAGVVYRVTYVGGSGNDVVLTVQTVPAVPVPAAPDTGFKLIGGNPLISLALTSMAGVALIGANHKAKSYKRR